MITIEYTHLDDEERTFSAEEQVVVPFPGDEVLCGSVWGPMRVVRRTFVYDESGALAGVIVWVRKEGDHK